MQHLSDQAGGTGQVDVQGAVGASAQDATGPRFARIDLSSWISWICYGVGLRAVLSPEVLADIGQLGLGAALLSCSILMFFLAVIYLQRYMRLSLLANSFGAPRHLVDDGPFAYSRNPIYLAFLLPIAALGYYSPLIAALTAAIYVLAMTRLVIRDEEQVLGRLFGAEYEAYKARVPRWIGIPGLNMARQRR